VALALTGYEIGLLTVALVFIAFALIVALVIPRSRPEFPTKWLGVFIGICVVLFVAQMGAVLALAELGEEEETEAVEPREPGPTEPGPTEPGPTEPGPTEPGPTEPTPTEPAPGGQGGDPAAGREVFLSNCGSCHTLADAGTTGTVGPNLDSSSPPTELVVERVTNGMGVMPSFADTLSEQQIADVAAYVSSAAGS
jgi:cytochrome c553